MESDLVHRTEGVHLTVLPNSWRHSFIFSRAFQTLAQEIELSQQKSVLYTTLSRFLSTRSASACGVRNCYLYSSKSETRHNSKLEHSSWSS